MSNNFIYYLISMPPKTESSPDSNSESFSYEFFDGSIKLYLDPKGRELKGKKVAFLDFKFNDLNGWTNEVATQNLKEYTNAVKFAAKENDWIVCPVVDTNGRSIPGQSFLATFFNGAKELLVYMGPQVIIIPKTPSLISFLVTMLKPLAAQSLFTTYDREEAYAIRDQAVEKSSNQEKGNLNEISKDNSEEQ